MTMETTARPPLATASIGSRSDYGAGSVGTSDYNLSSSDTTDVDIDTFTTTTVDVRADLTELRVRLADGKITAAEARRELSRRIPRLSQDLAAAKAEIDRQRNQSR